MLALSFLKRDFRIAISYRIAFVLQLWGILFIVPLFYFGSKMVEGSGSEFLKPYGGNFFAFVLIGVALIDFTTVSLRSFSEGLRESQLMGTLEIVLLSPVRLSEVLIYSSIWGYLLTTFRFLLYIGFGALFGMPLGKANVPAAVLVLLLAILSFGAIGMLVASIIMIIKRGETLNTLVGAVSTFLGGVLYPITVLPDWLASIAKLLPVTHALQAMRLSLIEGYSIWELLPQLGILAGFAAVLLPIAFGRVCARRTHCQDDRQPRPILIDDIDASIDSGDGRLALSARSTERYAQQPAARLDA